MSFIFNAYLFKNENWIITEEDVTYHVKDILNYERAGYLITKLHGPHFKRIHENYNLYRSRSTVQPIKYILGFVLKRAWKKQCLRFYDATYSRFSMLRVKFRFDNLTIAIIRYHGMTLARIEWTSFVSNKDISFNTFGNWFCWQRNIVPTCNTFLYNSHSTAYQRRNRFKSAVIVTEAILASVDDYMTCIHKNWWYKHNKGIHNKAVYIFHKIYCKS